MGGEINLREWFPLKEIKFIKKRFYLPPQIETDLKPRASYMAENLEIGK